MIRLQLLETPYGQPKKLFAGYGKWLKTATFTRQDILGDLGTKGGETIMTDKCINSTSCQAVDSLVENIEETLISMRQCPKKKIEVGADLLRSKA